MAAPPPFRSREQKTDEEELREQIEIARAVASGLCENCRENEALPNEDFCAACAFELLPPEGEGSD